MSATTMTGEGPMTCDGSARTTHQLLGRIQAALGRITGQPPAPQAPEDTAAPEPEDEEED